ncbi:MAG: HAD family hydrolase [Cellulomonadaceae bacterium]|jgi:HAD superfamily hydrolase (TIGR01549 family)|nr:HAD family hydrolase [Cellulomonadaceae bacterium]
MDHAVVFDVGETLVCETRIWLRWAERLNIPAVTFAGVLGGCIAEGKTLEETFEILVPGISIPDEEARWAVDEPESLRSGFDADDLYPDVRPALEALQAAGFRVVIAGNQPAEALASLQAMDLPCDVIANSSEIGVEKPDPAFFSAVAELAGVERYRISYIGDRLDNDVFPAMRAGMRPFLIRRGPFGYMHAAGPDAFRTTVIDSLMELPEILTHP